MMGQSITKLRKEITQEGQKREFEERLQILEKMIEQRLEIEKIAILHGEKNDQEIDTGTIVSLHKMVFIKTEKKESEDLNKVIHQLFSGDFIGGLESIVQLGAESVLGNDSVGEYNSTDMFIVWSDNALLRCDTYYYRWNFVSKSVINEVEGVTGCLLMKRVIDITKTDPQVLTWAITRMADRFNNATEEKPAESEDVINEALKVLKNVVKIQSKIKLAVEASAND
jgi:hypothetical protein